MQHIRIIDANEEGLTVELSYRYLTKLLQLQGEDRSIEEVCETVLEFNAMPQEEKDSAYEAFAEQLEDFIKE